MIRLWAIAAVVVLVVTIMAHGQEKPAEATKPPSDKVASEQLTRDEALANYIERVTKEVESDIKRLQKDIDDLEKTLSAYTEEGPRKIVEEVLAALKLRLASRQAQFEALKAGNREEAEKRAREVHATNLYYGILMKSWVIPVLDANNKLRERAQKHADDKEYMALYEQVTALNSEVANLMMKRVEIELKKQELLKELWRREGALTRKATTKKGEPAKPVEGNLAGAEK